MRILHVTRSLHVFSRKTRNLPSTRGENIFLIFIFYEKNQLGLTYGINSSLAGMEDKRDGTWRITGTFAPSLLQKGIEETIKQIENFAEKGITEGKERNWVDYAFYV